jgi:hypothetical protein
MLISILAATLAGFGLAYFGYQPQIDNMKNELAALKTNNDILRSEIAYLNSTAMNQQSFIDSLETNISMLQNKNQNLSSTLASLQLNLSTLEMSYTMLKYENAALNDTIKTLGNYVSNLSLATDSTYYIFKNDNTYYAKSRRTGLIEYKNDGCSAVINYTLTHIPYGGAVLFEPLNSSDDAYYVDTAITPPNGTTLASQNRMVTIHLSNNTIVSAVIDLTNVTNVQIRNIRIDGNKGNATTTNTTGSGIVIDSNSSYASNHLIENVVIDNCNETGLLIRHYPLNNVVINVQVFHSETYNLEVDSADNKLINVESGWACLSGFQVRGVDNYFLNCISYGCGQSGRFAHDDGNGFSVHGARNMFVGCDAGANFNAGFLIDHAVQTMLESCVGRDNGRNSSDVRIPGQWGFDLFDSNTTILSGCLSTDENDPENKTQDWGFTEGGNCDFNTVIGCNFDGNRVGAVAALIGVHSTITNTIGYETKNSGLTNFRYGAANTQIDIGTNDAFGAPRNFTSGIGAIVDFHVTIQWSIINSGAPDENVTVMLQALLGNGTWTSLNVSKIAQANCPQVYALKQEDALQLWANSTMIQELLISAKTTENATQAEVRVSVWGSGV